MADLVRVRRALVSVSDKTDLVPFARSLAAAGVELISTGGTAGALAEAGIDVTHVSDITGFPEIMDGRVKTLHPAVHGALLGLRDDPSHQAAMREHGIEPIDLVVVNLYPFEAVASRAESAQAEVIEQIDIGGPCLIRSAAKNFAWVAVVTSPRQYDRVAGELAEHDGCTSLALRASLAAAAFSRTAEYDAAISAYLSRRSPEAFPEILRMAYTKARELRYGENPHQDAALYRDPGSVGPSVVNAKQLHGKPLSYNNIGDAAAALEVAKALRKHEPDLVGACVVKHTNPCGVAVGAGCLDAVEAALAGDPTAAYGGILAVNRSLDEPSAERLCESGAFLEVIVAPEFADGALARLKERWINLRILAVGDRTGSTARRLDMRSVPGGLLVQDRDTRSPSPDQWRHRAGPAPTPALVRAAGVMEIVAKFLSSNAVAIGGEDAAGTNHGKGAIRLFGAGAGQMDRVASCRIAVEKAGAHARGGVAVSDAFFPFDDGPRVLIEAGVAMIVHPGGSKRDEDTFRVCEANGVTCMTTGTRHFRH